MSPPVDLAIGSPHSSATVNLLWRHRWFIGVILTYSAAVALIFSLLDRSLSFSLSIYTGSFALLSGSFCIGFLILHPIMVMVRRRPERLIATIRDELRGTYLTYERLFPAALVIVAIPIFISAFTSFKSIIPMIHPFSWDPVLADLDRWLHGGTDPWRLLQPLLGTPLVTTIVNAFYNIWYFLFYGVLFWQAFSLSNKALRMRFLLSFLLVWALLGSLGAVLLSSAGPVYFGRVTGLEDPFRELMDYLAAADTQSPVWALPIQEMLWDSYQQDGTGFGSGISAMPSVHVGLSVLLALLGWKVNRVLGVLLTVYAIIIEIGSVHLGWHYAIDGYFAAVLTWLIWLLTGRFLDRFGDPVSEAAPLSPPAAQR